MSATQQFTTQSETTTQFGVEDVIERLGVQVLTKGETEDAAAKTSTALAAFRAAPTIKAIGRDLARVAATTSDNPEGARRRWLDRLVMTRDHDGRTTDMPRIVGASFEGQRQVVDGVEDIGIGTTVNVDDLGRIEIQPLFTVLPPSLAYIAASQDGTLIPTRRFYGVLFAPKSEKGAFKFVPLELADPMLIARWNGIIDQGIELGTSHKDWPRIEAVETTIGKAGQRLLELTPKYMVEKKFPRRRRGEIVKDRDNKPIMDSEWRIATRFLKAVVLHTKSQNLPPSTAGTQPFDTLVFSYVERENSILVMLRGRPGEVDTSTAIATIEEVGEHMNPFDVLATTVERFDAIKARAFVDRCLATAIDNANPLYVKAIELGLVIEGQTNTVICPQLRTLADEALRKAKSLWDEALKATWEALKRYDLPSIEVCLAGRKLAEVKTGLNQPEDAVALWITSHITGEFSWKSPFFRELRIWALNAAAKRADYRDHAAEPEALKADGAASGEPTDDQAKPKPEAAAKGSNGHDAATADKPARATRKPRGKKAGATTPAS